MFTTCFEPDDPSSGRKLCIQYWYSMFHIHQYKQSSRQKSVFDSGKYLVAKILISWVPGSNL